MQIGQDSQRWRERSSRSQRESVELVEKNHYTGPEHESKSLAKTQVAVMEGTHGRDEADSLAVIARFVSPASE